MQEQEDFTHLFISGIGRRAEGTCWMGLQQVLNVGNNVYFVQLDGSEAADIRGDTGIYRENILAAIGIDGNATKDKESTATMKLL